MQPAENPTKSDKVHPLSLEPFSDKHTCDPHKNIETGMEVGDESFIVGRPKLPPSKVHEVTSPLKSIKEPLISLETTNTPLSPKRGNWKRVARTQGKKFQNVNPQTQNVAGLSSSKSIGKLDFMYKGEVTPQKKKKKNHGSFHTDTHDTCMGPFWTVPKPQVKVETRILGPLLVVLVDWAWFTATKWGLIMSQVVRKSHKTPQGKMRFLLSNKIPL